MRFVCSGVNKKVFEFLYEEIYEDGDTLTYSPDILSLLRDLFFEKFYADIIFLEHENHKSFLDFIYYLLNSKDLKIPLIVIGNPEMDEQRRLGYWISENEFQYDVQNLHLLIPLFRKISSALESEVIKNLICKPAEPLTADKLSKKIYENTKKKSNLELFRGKNELPPSVYNLLLFLYKNRAREVSIEEIEMQLNIECKSKKIRKNAAYAYISRLRKCMKASPACELRLLRTRTGYYKLFLS
ncbi:MAG: hypothetical protein IJ257_02605 [Treponema sp.]|nr:hypothetical protein [Treponema sp.]